jgi:hypothetical protein
MNAIIGQLWKWANATNLELISFVELNLPHLPLFSHKLLWLVTVEFEVGLFVVLVFGVRIILIRQVRVTFLGCIGFVTDVKLYVSDSQTALVRHVSDRFCLIFQLELVLFCYWKYHWLAGLVCHVFLLVGNWVKS